MNSSTTRGTMAPFITARLPLPPSVNASYTNIDGGRAATQELRQFKHDARWLLTQAIIDQHTLDSVRSSHVKTPLRLDLVFYFTTLWRRDTDNGVKAVQDALFDYLGLNDTLVCTLHVEKRVDRADPRVEVALSLIG